MLRLCLLHLPALGLPADDSREEDRLPHSHRKRWVYLDAHRVHPPLALPTARPAKRAGWSYAKLTDPLAEHVLARIEADLGSRLEGAQIVKEFLRQHLAPLQAH